jgi:hypothetical protein
VGFQPGRTQLPWVRSTHFLQSPWKYLRIKYINILWLHWSVCRCSGKITAANFKNKIHFICKLTIKLGGLYRYHCNQNHEVLTVQCISVCEVLHSKICYPSFKLWLTGALQCRK